jgi:arylsulfatase A-like enzyme
MPLRAFLLGLATLLPAALALAQADNPPAAAGASPGRPNIVVVVGDDMGYADVGVHGCTDIPTPHIDSIAKNGVRFTNGYVTGPYCSPTRAALLTGRYQQRFGHEFNPGPVTQPGTKAGLPVGEKTIADRLKAAGYKTGLIGKWHLGNAPEFHPQKRGFDEFYGFLGGAHPYLPGVAAAKQNPIYRGNEVVEETEYLTDAIAREGAAFIDRHRGEPFFLYLCFNAVHTPMQAPKEYLDRFPNIPEGNRRTYAAMMSAMDDGVGKVLGKLADLGLDGNTLVFFVSDNGGPPANASNNTPLRGHKASTWEGGIRVPFYFQWKGRLKAGQVYDLPVAQIDILPTALAAAGVKVEREAWKLDGVDLMPHLTGKNASPPHQDGLFWRFGDQRAVRVGNWKLVRGRAGPGRGAQAAKVTEWQLFDLGKDAGEQTDLAPKEADRIKELETAWKNWDEKNIPPAWKQPPPARQRNQQQQQQQRRQQRRLQQQQQETKAAL